MQYRRWLPFSVLSLVLLWVGFSEYFVAVFQYNSVTLHGAWRGLLSYISGMAGEYIVIFSAVMVGAFVISLGLAFLEVPFPWITGCILAGLCLLMLPSLINTSSNMVTHVVVPPAIGTNMLNGECIVDEGALNGPYERPWFFTEGCDADRSTIVELLSDSWWVERKCEEACDDVQKEDYCASLDESAMLQGLPNNVSVSCGEVYSCDLVQC